MSSDFSNFQNTSLYRGETLPAVEKTTLKKLPSIPSSPSFTVKRLALGALAIIGTQMALSYIFMQKTVNVGCAGLENVTLPQMESNIPGLSLMATHYLTKMLPLCISQPPDDFKLSFATAAKLAHQLEIRGICDYTAADLITKNKDISDVEFFEAVNNWSKTPCSDNNNAHKALLKVKAKQQQLYELKRWFREIENNSTSNPKKLEKGQCKPYEIIDDFIMNRDFLTSRKKLTIDIFNGLSLIYPSNYDWNGW